MGDQANENATNSTHTNPRQPNYDALKNHIINHKIDCGLWLIRVFTILFALGYLIPIFGSSQSYYDKVLIANAAISALRLHQRLGRVTLSRQFLEELIVEDSCHYLFYSMIFLFIPGVTMVLFPIVLFSMLHAASYSLTLLDTLGQNSWWGARLLISLVEFQSLNILRMVAFTEIVLMPYTVILMLTGRASLLTPFIYYQFLMQRYTSRRNPYTRNMFRELRVVAERTAAKPGMPELIRQAILAVVGFVSRCAPQMMPATPQQQ